MEASMSSEQSVNSADNNKLSDSQKSVTKSEEDDQLNNLSYEMLKSTGDYIRSEVDIVIADYKTLEKMNQIVSQKYNNLSEISTNINGEMSKLNDTYETLMPMLAQIDELEKCISRLEKSATKLDDYSKRLDTRYRQIQEKYVPK